MAAQQSRKPPNNVLFCDPPPTLPPIILLPNNLLCDCDPQNSTTTAVVESTEYPHSLHGINNVGVPTSDSQNNEILNSNMTRSNSVDTAYTFINYLQRGRSCNNISDLYDSCNENDRNIFRPSHSEPDLSKYDLYLEADVMIDNLNIQGAPSLILNNPFYESSNTFNPTQINQNVVVLPDNYLAFEDSFVPSWDYKPELLVDKEMNTGIYYEGLPLIPSSDPWSLYGSNSNAFEYYSPQFDVPVEDCMQYMRLTDLDCTAPQYFNLPLEETSRVEEVNANENLCNTIKSSDAATDNFQDAQTVNLTEEILSQSPINLLENKENNLDTLANRESSTRISDEESLNADISIDVTSSLAFLPSSKSSARPAHCSDDTSEDTSPHEHSPLSVEDNKVIKSEVNVEYDHNVLNSNKRPINVPLSQLPSIPINNSIVQLPQTVSKDGSSYSKNELAAKSDEIVQSQVIPKGSSQVNNQHSKSFGQKPVTHAEITQAKSTNPIPQRPHPPAVPPAWLTKPTVNVVNQNVPKINVQNSEGVTTDLHQKKPQPVNQSRIEPQPSCSYIPPQPQRPQASQLNPEKQQQEVETEIVTAAGTSMLSQWRILDGAISRMYERLTNNSARTEIAAITFT
ncbi:unnamed protein product [Leptosia nina]|uniref:Uncharacterized protein n=1 Tax=Leptosia nina TaxID=320188 RepID=A0AAV1J5L7_9NEOP